MTPPITGYCGAFPPELRLAGQPGPGQPASRVYFTGEFTIATGIGENRKITPGYPADDAGIADHVLYHQDLTGENMRQPRAILRFKALGETAE
jgi:hypothetical protein